MHGRNALALGCALACALLAACADTTAPDPNSQTHWLRDCSTDTDCAGLLCVCGTCSTGCTSDGACQAELGDDAVCRAAQSLAPTQRCAEGNQPICVASCERESTCDALASGLECSGGLCTRAIGGTDDPSNVVATPDGGMSGDAQAGPPSLDSGQMMSDSGAISAQDAGNESSQQPTDAGSDPSDASDASDTPVLVTVCNAGMPELPLGAELFAANVVYGFWSVSQGVVSWIAGEVPGVWTLERRAVGSTDVTSEAGVDGFYPAGFASSGTTVSYGVWSTSDNPVKFTLRLSTQGTTALNIAMETVGGGYGAPRIEADDVYWIGSEGSTATLFRSPRVPGDSVSLGTMAPIYNPLGPHVVGAHVFAANTTTSAGQLYRAPKDGSSSLAPIGDPLPVIGAFETDGTDTYLMLQHQRDMLGNPIGPGRVARLLEDGTLETKVELDGDFESVAVGAGRAFWYQPDGVWSAPLDGSASPTQLIGKLGDYMGYRIFVDGGYVYLIVTCNGTESSHDHIVRVLL